MVVGGVWVGKGGDITGGVGGLECVKESKRVWGCPLQNGRALKACRVICFTNMVELMAK